jgi:hypothetical protein
MEEKIKMVVMAIVEMKKNMTWMKEKEVTAGHSGRAVWGVGLGRLAAGIVGSNPAQGMDVCLRFSVLCCPV